MSEDTWAEEEAGRIFQALQMPSSYDAKNGIPKGAYIYVAAALRSARNRGLEEAVKLLEEDEDPNVLQCAYRINTLITSEKK